VSEITCTDHILKNKDKSQITNTEATQLFLSNTCNEIALNYAHKTYKVQINLSSH